MNKPVVVLAAATLALAAAPNTAAAQCASSPTVTRQACFATVDLVNYLTPQLATAIAGGSSTLGQSGVLGGLGHFAVSVRGTGILNGAFPLIDDNGFRPDGQPQSYATEAQIIPGAGVDASLGLTKGWSLGATRVGGLDLLVSALYAPNAEDTEGGFSLKAKDGNLKLGYGLRVGILDESVITPGLHVSYLKRDLPVMSLTGSTQASGGSTVSGTFALNDFTMKTTAIRLVAAKSLLVLGLQAGIGQDKYESSAIVQATVSGQSTSAQAAMSMTRTNMFVGATLNLFLIKLAIEAGQVSGGSLPAPFNSFDEPADKSRTYVSGGVRISF